MEDEYITVSDLNRKLQRHISAKFINLKIRGEISQPKISKTGNHYFDLKDENSKVSCVLYRNWATKTIKPEEGMDAIINGKITIYHQKGIYNLQVTKIRKAGVGELHLKYLKLCEKLKEEGLFDDDHKKEIPKNPKRIGVITAKSGAVIHDIITTTKRRWPFCEIILFPSLVQGDSASRDLIRQLRRADGFNLDTLIIGRGGGSLEDLWCFNDETLAREVYNCRTPIISAVGHESDNAITDFVADMRAPTPTAAAELAVPDISQKINKLKTLKKRLENSMELKLNNSRQHFDYIMQSRVLNNPETIYTPKREKFDNLKYRIENTAGNLIRDRRNHFNGLQKDFTNLSRNLTRDKRNTLNITTQKLEYSSKNLIKTKTGELERLTQSLEYGSKSIINNSQNRLETIKRSSILKNPERIVEYKKTELEKTKEKLTLLNPRKTLKRGYTLTKHDQKVIISSKRLKKDDEIEIEFDDGTVNAKVI